MGKIKVEEEEKEKCKSINDIRNKVKRRAIANKEAIKKKKAKKEERKRRKEAGEAPQIPKTIESLRVPDETILDPNKPENEEKIEEIERDIKTDNFSSYFNMEYVPKVLITFADNPLKKTRVLGVELCRVIPNSLFRFRARSSIKKIVKRAKEKNFSDVIIINEDRKTREPDGFLLVHLPDGPSAYFRMSNVRLTTDLKKNFKEINSYRPEVILNNFTTRLGSNVARMLASIFHYNPEFKGKRAVTFHNQRDYIFFRHHRYDFDKKGKPMIKELGPRFTLRLEYIQEGTFDTKLGEYEWIKSGRRHDLESNRRKFYL